MAALCEVCGIGEMTSGGSSLLFCTNCGSQSTAYVDEAFDAENTHMYNPTFKRDRGAAAAHDVEQDPLEMSQPTSAALNSQPQSDFQRSSAGDGTGSEQLHTTSEAPLPASQFGQMLYPGGRIPDDQLAGVIRSSYVGGLQKILQLQCEALVKEFRVNSLICGVAGTVWLKYVASTRVFETVWEDEVVEVAEHREGERKGKKASRAFQDEERPAPMGVDPEPEPELEPDPGPEPEPELEPTPSGLDLADPALMRGSLQRRKKRAPKAPRKKSSLEPRTTYGRQLRFIWLNALKERIPLSITLAICFLACYFVREPVLPTDLIEWAAEGRLPYLSAFVEISKPASHHIPNTIGGKRFFPIDPSRMFRPSSLLGSRRLELLAGFIAERISLRIPPINFLSVAARLLREMGLSRTKTLDHAQRLHSWYAPSGLWVSGNKKALPTRVYVVAMLVVAMKVFYRLDGRSYQVDRESDCNAAQDAAGSVARKSGIELQPVHKMVTRRANKPAEQHRKAAVEKFGVSETKERKSTETSDLGDAAETSQAAMAREERTASPCARTREGETEERGGFVGKKSKSPERNCARQLEGKDVGDAKELIRILEGTKIRNKMSDDEKLLKYLQYCQNVVFSGFNRDSAVESAVDQFWDLYKSREQADTKETSEHVSVEEDAMPFSATKSELRRSSATDEEQEGTRSVSGSGSAAQENSRDDPEIGQGPPGNDSSTMASSQRGGADLRKATKRKRIKSSRNNTIDKIKHSEEGVELANLTEQMNNAGFEYMPPLSKPVDSDIYMRYNLQSPDGLIAVHGDYFRVLRAFGRKIDVHPKAIHRCVTIIERGLLQVEGNVEKFLSLQQNLVLPEEVKRRNPPRRRDKSSERDRRLAAARNVEHLTDLSYI